MRLKKLNIKELRELTGKWATQVRNQPPKTAPGASFTKAGDHLIMRSKKTPECTESYCRAPAVGMRLCKKHLDEHYEKEKRRDEAVRFLHTGMLDDQTIQNAKLNDEFRRLKVWWSRACDAINCQVEDTILKDETGDAITWCVNLAIVIIKEEKAYRGGDQSPPPWNPLREQLWERFKNLEAGLRSNGVPRPKAKQNPQR